MVEVVWFKRDLRVVDHSALIAAVATGGPVVCLYIAEPELWAQAGASARQWRFVQESLQELRRDLALIAGRSDRRRRFTPGSVAPASWHNWDLVA